ncbi:MAG: 5-formyltetrahydrofolate cyclo-ligase [Sphingomonadaceae bacterium]|nr:5-formyltetrahydrofolate cyclo-ligase [Sphingomonadaceae bacterium]
MTRDRSRLRREARLARQAFASALAPAVRRGLEAAIARQVLPLIPQAAVVAGYAAQDGEPDVVPWLARRGVTIAFPRVGSQGLSFHPSPPEALAPGAFGILEPPAHLGPVAPDLVLAPLLLFDRAGRRLGRGAGLYDRTLHALRARGTVRVIGIAWDWQEVAELPQASWDERLDAVATPTRFLDFRSDARPGP